MYSNKVPDLGTPARCGAQLVTLRGLGYLLKAA